MTIRLANMGSALADALSPRQQNETGGWRGGWLYLQVPSFLGAAARLQAASNIEMLWR
jgi:hypothetical protein